VDLEVPRSSRGGGTNKIKLLSRLLDMLASQQRDWEAHGKQKSEIRESPDVNAGVAGTRGTASFPFRDAAMIRVRPRMVFGEAVRAILADCRLSFLMGSHA
jgi:hypothetical protein